MKLRVRLPIDLYLSGSNCENLVCSTAFEHRSWTVTLCLEPWEVLEKPEIGVLKKYFRITRAILLLVDDANSPLKIAGLLPPSEHSDLVKHLAKLINRVIRVFHSFGLVSSLEEIRKIGSDDADRTLRTWRVEQRAVETDSWIPIVAPEVKPDGTERISSSDSLAKNFLQAARWPEIEEALQGKLEPPPEREFGANCIQHLITGNYRLAVLESIIGLEIVLADYLREALREKGFSDEEAKNNVLTPSITLHFRANILLRLMLSKDDLAQANLQEVLKVNHWRNTVVHRRGNLPQELPEKEIETGVKAVVSLTQLLSLRRDELRASPALRTLATKVGKKFGVPAPSFWYGFHHFRIAHFRVFTLPPPERLHEMVGDIAEGLSNIDEFFRAERHLTVVFRGPFGNLLAKWSDGKWSDKETNVGT
jgi:hypothetical protein